MASTNAPSATCSDEAVRRSDSISVPSTNIKGRIQIPKLRNGQFRHIWARKTTYSYEPFVDESQDIRLLTLLPGKFSAKVRVVLEHVRFNNDNPPVYEALSYAWGSPEDPAMIKVGKSGNKTLAVTKNLAIALRHLRYGNRPRTLWVDAICVDQQNTAERSKQVQRMGDVYRLADRVIAWVGPEADDSRYALELLADIGPRIKANWTLDKMEPMTSDLEDAGWADGSKNLPWGAREMSAVSRLMLRPWFQRLWVQQEVGLAGPKAVLACGLDHIPWSWFRTAVFAVNRKSTPKGTLDAKKDAALSKRVSMIDSLCSDPSSMGFEKRLYFTQDCKCSDDRDRIFALLKIHEQTHTSLNITPDYAAPVADVYKAVALRIMERSGYLDVLKACELRDARNGTREMPSWVPDWSAPRFSQPLSTSFASGPSFPVWTYLTGDILRVRGKSIDCLEDVQETHMDHQSALQDIRQLRPSCEPDEIYVGGGTILDAYCDVLHAGAFEERTIPRLSWRPTLQASRNVVKRIWETEGSVSLNSPKDEWGASSVHNNRTTFISKLGYIGLAPSTARPGDQISAFLGCSSCMLLRPVGNDKWQVVGECYVSGMMNGEAFLGPLPDKYLPVKFVDQESLWRDGFKDHMTGEIQREDPRSDESDFPAVGSLVTGEWVSGKDYRWQQAKWEIKNETERCAWPCRHENLLRQGVELKWFDLV